METGCRQVNRGGAIISTFGVPLNRHKSHRVPLFGGVTDAFFCRFSCRMRRDRELCGRDACSHTGVRQRPTAGASARVVSPSHSYPTTRIVGFSPSPSQRNGRKRLSPLATIALWPAKIAIAHDCEFGKLRCCSHGRPPPAAGAEGLASLAFDRLRKTA